MSEPVAYINVEERKLEWAKPITWHTPTIAQMDKIPLYTHPAKTLTDEEILGVLNKIADNNESVYSVYKDFSEIEFSKLGIFEFARAILRKAQEK